MVCCQRPKCAVALRLQLETHVLAAQAAQKAPEQLERTADAAIRTGEGLLSDLAAAKRSLEDQGVRFGDIIGYGLLAACTFGFAFQVPLIPLARSVHLAARCQVLS